MARSNAETPVSAVWRAHYEALLNWSSRTVGSQHVNCPKDCVVGNLPIGTWLVDQRARMRGTDKSIATLDGERRALLQALVDDGKLWLQNPERRSWDEVFQAWTRWAHEKHGGNDYNVHHNEEYEGIRLGTWVNLQRMRLRDKSPQENGKTPLTAQQKAALLELVAQGKFRIDAVDRFPIKFDLMMKWSEETVGGRHCNVPYDCVYEGERLGVWLNTQRQRLRGGTTKSKSELKAEQREMLEKLVQERKLWVSEPNMWDEKYNLLLQWSEDNNNGEHVNIPQAAPPYKGVQLGSWLATQRNRFRGKLGKMKPLTPEQELKLNELITQGKLKMKPLKQPAEAGNKPAGNKRQRRA